MKRITKKIWFGKKRFGWGLRPVSWEGWLATLAFVAVALADAFVFRKGTPSTVILVADLVIFLAVAILTGDSLGSEK